MVIRDRSDMVRLMMNAALAMADAGELLERYGFPGKYFSHEGKRDLVARTLALEIGEGKAVEDELEVVRQRAAATCFLDKYGSSGYGMRRNIFSGKGREWRQAIQEAGHELWKLASQDCAPVFGPIVFPDDDSGETGLYMGRAFFGDDGEDGIDGRTPPLPVGTDYEQNHLAREGLKKTRGEAAKYPQMLAVDSAENWQAVIKRTAAILKAQRTSARAEISHPKVEERCELEEVLRIT